MMDCGDYYFLALDPCAALRRLVLDYKRRVGSLVGPQLFLDDPPHATVYLAAFDDAAELERVVARVVAAMPAPRGNVVGWEIFPADPLTGRNTLALQLAQDDIEALRQWQKSAVESLAPLRDYDGTRRRYDERFDALGETEQRAVETWGFPYVGEGWRPHVTIASIRPEDWEAVERTLLVETPHANGNFPTATLFRLDDGRPTPVRIVRLREAKSARPRIGPRRDTPTSAARLQSGLGFEAFRAKVVSALDAAVAKFWWVDSATVAGSFLTSGEFAAASDIDFIVIVDHLNAARFGELQETCRAALEPLAARVGYALRINPTLGPLKFNDARTAVLHLMAYSRAGHVAHVLDSPFTCFDWQRSRAWFKLPLADVFPTFSLAPRNFLSARRGPRDYLADFRRRVVSYRELECTASGYREERRCLPMNERDRVEFAWHVVKFLMQNLVKLVRRRNEAVEGEALCSAYLGIFKENESSARALFADLLRQKRGGEWMCPPALDERLENFVTSFDRQFRRAFIERATRHVVFRHAATEFNRGQGDAKIFLGRGDPAILPCDDRDFVRLCDELVDARWEAAYVSPLERCRTSYEALREARGKLPDAVLDERLMEIHYGACEGLRVGQARRRFPELFAAWEKGEDPAFPGGESTADVVNRLTRFVAERWERATANTIACTHNVVIRALAGRMLGVPRRHWHRLTIGHLEPLEFIYTRDFGLFANFDERALRSLLADFMPAGVASPAAREAA